MMEHIQQCDTIGAPVTIGKRRSMTIFCIGHTKGGTGKTTTGVQLALGLSAKGARVWFVDGDAQQTGMQMLTNREEMSGLEPLAASGFGRPAELRVQVKAQARHFDHVVIDVGGGMSDMLAAAMLLADALITPVCVGMPSLWALRDVERMIAQAEAMREVPLKCRAMLNRADPKKDTPDNEAARVAVSGCEYLTLMKAEIVDRKAIGRASERGLTVKEFTREAAPVAEIARFITEAQRI